MTLRSKAAPSKPHTRPETVVVRTASKDSVRETIESIAIAFVLAFLFRTFEAEAFVIPTGSMAPTLMGQHKDFNCVECGYPLRVSASEEGPDEPFPKQIVGCTCPNCRYEMTFGEEGKDGPIPPTYKGDRIIVAKFPYEIEEPERWDVAVFKYPLTAKTNFIKRLVGLPRETVQIYHGDILTRPEGGAKFSIERKPPSKVRAMLQPVYDNDYVLLEMIERGWPSRWHSEAGAPEQGAWEPAADRKSFSANGKAGEAWLRYSHFVPSVSDWGRLVDGPLDAARRAAIRPQLITDFYAYNTGKSLDELRNPRRSDIQGLHWVGDLALECQLQVRAARGGVTVELVEGGRRFHCRIDLATGETELASPDLPGYQPKAKTAIHAAGNYRLLFANVDDKLFLWINDTAVKFDQPTAYDARWQPPDRLDYESPVGVASRGADVGVAALRVLRDIYYIADMYNPRPLGPAVSDYAEPLVINEEGLPAFVASGDLREFPVLRPVEFKLEANQFLMLGDNSPRSKDSRLWPNEHYVRRDLLIGKAMFVYWPHALNHIPGTHIWFPLFPNFARMNFIR